MGREAVKKNDYRGAAELFELVLSERSRVEQVRWEYAQILYTLERFSEASPIVEGLIESQPNNMDYLILGGRVSLKLQEPSRAARYFEHAYLQQKAQDIIGTGDLLRNLVTALLESNRPDEAFVYLEKLHRLDPGDPQIPLQLARLARELEWADKAGTYYAAAIKGQSNSIPLMHEAAVFFQKSDQGERAVALWKRLLTLEPDNISYHQSLIDHYRLTDHPDDALPHLLVVVEKGGSSDPRLLLETARIYHGEQGQNDLALLYYERYLEVRPHDGVARQEAQEARNLFAQELLMLIENGQERLAWQKAETTTADPALLYTTMAENLPSAAKDSTAIAVLEKLYSVQPQNDRLALRLATLYTKTGQVAKAYEAYHRIDDSTLKDYSYHLRLAELELLSGYDLAGLATLSKALSMQPGNDELRIRCVRLAGELGRLDEMERFAATVNSRPLKRDQMELITAYAQGLSRNGLYDSGLQLLKEAALIPGLSERQQEDVELLRAQLLLRRGDPLGAESLVRQRVAGSVEVGDRTVALFMEFLLRRGSPAEARMAGEALASSAFTYQESSPALNSDRLDIFLASIRLLAAEGNPEKGISDLSRKLWETDKAGEHDVRNRLALELSRLYLNLGQRRQCLQLIRRLEQNG